MHAIEEVARGGSVIDPIVVEALVANRTGSSASALGRLTPREREVLEQMAQGRNNAGIAEALFLSERAVEKHINSLFSKLGLSEEPDVHRRVKAVLLYLCRTGGRAPPTSTGCHPGPPRESVEPWDRWTAPKGRRRPSAC